MRKTNDKPELGCKPYYIASRDRVSELAQAIDRNSENIDVEYNKIEMWATEIIAHCRLAKDFDEVFNP